MLERKYIMAEVASKGVAGSGLGLGIAGTTLGLLNNGGNGGGVLGGLFGNNNQATISALQAELKCCCEKQELREQFAKAQFTDKSNTN